MLLDFVPSSTAVLCSAHFREEDLDRTSASMIVRVRDNAIPSIFSAFPKHLQKKTKKRRPPPERSPRSVTSVKQVTLLCLGLLYINCRVMESVTINNLLCSRWPSLQLVALIQALSGSGVRLMMFIPKWHSFYARQHRCYSAYMLSPICLSVRHTGGSYKNG